MKRIFILLMTLLIVITAVAQKKYVKSKNLDPFVGTWEYKTATETFTIEFRKSNFQTKDIDLEQVHGMYKYIKNGVVIGDYMHLMSNSFNNTMAIRANNSNNTPADAIYGYVQDKKLDKEGVLFFTLVSGKTDEARWQLMDAEGAYVVGISEPPLKGFSVPTDVIMKKIK